MFNPFLRGGGGGFPILQNPLPVINDRSIKSDKAK